MDENKELPGESPVKLPENLSIPRKKAPLWGVILAFIFLAGLLITMGLGIARSTVAPIQMGQPAPAFKLSTFSGQTIPLESLRGKVVLIHFWASWCTSCYDEAALVEQAWQKYQSTGEVIFLGVDYVDTEAPALEFIKKYGFTFTNGPDLRSDISTAYHVTGVPETYVIDRQGNLAWIQPGPFTSLQEISATIELALKSKRGG